MEKMNKVLALCCGLLVVLGISACGNKNDSNSSPVPPAITNSTCQAGYLYSTQYGCLPQGNCSAGYGQYNGQCVYIGMNNVQSCQGGYIFNQTYGCLPQTGCPAGYGMYNNQCIPATATPYGGGSMSCQGSCQPGYTQTQMGCLPQGTCMACYGVANGWCYPATSASSYGNMYMH